MGTLRRTTEGQVDVDESSGWYKPRWDISPRLDSDSQELLNDRLMTKERQLPLRIVTEPRS
jgi:hypothetical protein